MDYTRLAMDNWKQRTFYSLLHSLANETLRFLQPWFAVFSVQPSLKNPNYGSRMCNYELLFQKVVLDRDLPVRFCIVKRVAKVLRPITFEDRNQLVVFQKRCVCFQTTSTYGKADGHVFSQSDIGRRIQTFGNDLDHSSFGFVLTATALPSSRQERRDTRFVKNTAAVETFAFNIGKGSCIKLLPLNVVVDGYEGADRLYTRGFHSLQELLPL